MSKKKKDKIEEQPKKTKVAKEKPAKAEAKKKNIVPASLPVLVQAKAPAAEAPVPPAEPTPAAPKAKKTAAKKAPAKKKSKPAAEEPVVETVVIEEIVISNDDIALRAYFIAQDRQARGQWGDETGDWVEAERQLRAEAAAKKK